MPKKEHTDMPDYYAVCQHADCPKASECLHQLAYAPQLEKQTLLRILNLTHCTKDDRCPHFRSNAPVTFARGFKNFQQKMYPHQYAQFMNLCIAHFSRNPYFERRRSARLLSPAEQEFILDTLREVGVTEDLQFDGYEDRVNWGE